MAAATGAMASRRGSPCNAAGDRGGKASLDIKGQHHCLHAYMLIAGHAGACGCSLGASVNLITASLWQQPEAASRRPPVGRDAGSVARDLGIGSVEAINPERNELWRTAGGLRAPLIMYCPCRQLNLADCHPVSPHLLPICSHMRLYMWAILLLTCATAASMRAYASAYFSSFWLSCVKRRCVSAWRDAPSPPSPAATAARITGGSITKPPTDAVLCPSVPCILGGGTRIITHAFMVEMTGCQVGCCVFLLTDS